MAGLMAGTRAAAQTERVVHSFNYVGRNDGAGPYGGVVADASGNLYGTTISGGTGLCSIETSVVQGCGTVFELSPRVGGGGYTERILHNFINTIHDGNFPEGKLTFDGGGNLFGTTSWGGAGPCADGTYQGCGMVFELSPSGDGRWSYKAVYSFRKNGRDGTNPEGGLIIDSAGNLYGTTFGGGTYGFGTVFELSPAVGGGWTESILHSFNKNGTDGYFSNDQIFGALFYTGATLTMDAAGNLYGTTDWGGNAPCTNAFGTVESCGTVFELSPSSGGLWTETILHNFSYSVMGILSSDGANPEPGVIFDAAGNLWGTAAYGGESTGTVFELTPVSGGGWNEIVACCSTGASPYGGVTFDAAGNFYGTTTFGGNYCGFFYCGTVFKYTKSGGGWAVTLVHSFSDNGTDGFQPFGPLTIDTAGHIFGTTSGGGTGMCIDENDSPVAGCGTVFEIVP
jgi:uncharacterized repeat protein (TIGR03803 family)